MQEYKLGVVAVLDGQLFVQLRQQDGVCECPPSSVGSVFSAQGAKAGLSGSAAAHPAPALGLHNDPCSSEPPGPAGLRVPSRKAGAISHLHP